MLNKLEIDVMQANELNEAASLAHKYNMPAIVVHPGISSEAHIIRGKTGSKFKLIVPIDWPKGENYGIAKMRGMNVDSLEADGFEILLTPNKLETETRNEAKAITDFIRTHISKTAEIRFIINILMREQYIDIISGLKGIPTPAFVRNDINLKVQVSKANAETHNQFITTFSEHYRSPIKISGNINNIKTMNSISRAKRFGVSLTQAKSIIKDYFKSKIE